jgi:hypothetical protein
MKRRPHERGIQGAYGRFLSCMCRIVAEGRLATCKIMSTCCSGSNKKPFTDCRTFRTSATDYVTPDSRLQTIAYRPQLPAFSVYQPYKLTKSTIWEVQTLLEKLNKVIVTRRHEAKGYKQSIFAYINQKQHSATWAAQ